MATVEKGNGGDRQGGGGGCDDDKIKEASL